MKVKFVTSFNEDLWTKYAKVTLDSWVDFIEADEGSVIECWILGAFPMGLPKQTKKGVPFVYKMVETQSPAWAMFFTQYKDHPRPRTEPGNEFKYNFIPFSVKVFALAEASFSIKENNEKFDYLCWLDADVKLTAPVNTSFLKELINNKSIAWLDRGPPWGHGETGFILSTTDGDALDIFLQQANIYGSGQLFYFAEWHDAFVFTSLVRLKAFMEFPDYQVVNLNLDMKSAHKNGLYPFETSPLASHMIHFKGNTKEKVTA